MTDADDEVTELRAELARLQVEVARAREGDQPPTAGAAPARSGVWRPIVVTVLLVLVGLLAPMAVVAIWAEDQISDTDRYAETVAPLASDPAVQAAIADRVTTEVFRRLDVKAVTQQAVDALEQQGLPPRVATRLSALATPLASGVEGFVHEQVLRLVESEEFRQAWVAANRAAHDEVVAVLTGETGGAVVATGDTVSLNLAPVIASVKKELTSSGFALASRIPSVDAEFTIFTSPDIEKAQDAIRLIGTASRVLPVLALVLLGVAVALGRSRRRTLVAGALVVALSMVLLGMALNGFRVVYLDAVPTDELPADAAAAVYDALVQFIRVNLRAVLVLFLAVAAIAWVTGPAPAPTAVRRGTSRALDVGRHGTARVGLGTGRAGAAVFAYRTPIRVTVLGLALVAYAMATYPTAGFALTLLVVVAVVLLLVELVAHPPARPTPTDPTPT